MSIEVEISNFQAIDYIRFVIDGFTFIGGKSDIGKSSITRAISSVWSNPTGDSFIRHETDQTSVSLYFKKENFKVKWSKKRGKGGVYVINDDENLKFENLYSSLPKPVLDFGLSFLETRESKEKIYPQICEDQHNNLFMVFDSGSKKAEILAEIAEVTNYTKALRLVLKDKRSKKSELGTRDKDLRKINKKYDLLKNIDLPELRDTFESGHKNAKESINLYKHLKELSKDVKKVNLYLKEEKNIPTEIQLYDLDYSLELVSSLLYYKKQYEYLLKFVEQEKAIPAELEKMSEGDSLDRVLRLNSLYKEYKNINNIISLSIPGEAEYKGKDLNYLLQIFRLSKEYTFICKFLNSTEDLEKIEDIDFEDLYTSIERLVSIRYEYLNLETEISGLKEEQEGVLIKLENICQELKEFKNCPFCGSENNNHEH